MEKSPSSEANSHSAKQEIPPSFCYTKVHYGVDPDPLNSEALRDIS